MNRFRFIVLVLSVLVICIAYLSRSNLNITIVSIVCPTTRNDSERLYSDYCPLPETSRQFLNASDDFTPDEADIIKAPKYAWRPETQGLILSAFFFPYVIGMIPAGRLAETYDSKWIITIALFGSGIINLLTPTFAKVTWLMVTSRIVLGLLQTGIFPSGYGILYKWFPKQERSIAFSFFMNGSAIGNFVANFLAGFVSEKYGWPHVFYISGGLAAAVATFVAIFVTKSPEISRFTDQAELKYIQMNRDDSNNNSDCSKTPAKPCKVPWIKIMTSRSPLCFMAHKFLNLAVFVISTRMPAYLFDIMNMHPSKIGIWMSLFTVASFVAAIIGATLTEWVIQRKWISRCWVRKSFVTVGLSLVGISMALIPKAGCDTRFLIFLIFVCQFFDGFVGAVNAPIPSEMTSNYVSTFFAICNTAGMIPGTFVPYVIGAILESGPNILHQWNLIFYLTAGLTFVSLVSFLCVNCERQDWDILEEDKVNIEASLEMSEKEVESDVVKVRSRTLSLYDVSENRISYSVAL